LIFERLSLPDVMLVQPKVFGDDRGFFLESWNRRAFADGGISEDFVQYNHSRSVQWTLRGLHYQVRHPQGKLVRVIRGAAFVVVVDLRRSSVAFGKWAGVDISEHNRHMLWVPRGFAHGFLALSPAVDFVYKCTDYYSPADERSIRWDDRTLAIDWPLPAGTAPILSARDADAPAFSDAEPFP
jgi:dTDP-4-dehydrorhamnose 3,5-epimerase